MSLEKLDGVIARARETAANTGVAQGVRKNAALLAEGLEAVRDEIATAKKPAAKKPAAKKEG